MNPLSVSPGCSLSCQASLTSTIFGVLSFNFCRRYCQKAVVGDVAMKVASQRRNLHTSHKNAKFSVALLISKLQANCYIYIHQDLFGS